MKCLYYRCLDDINCIDSRIDQMKVLKVDLHNIETELKFKQGLRDKICKFLNDIARILRRYYPDQEEIKLPDDVIFIRTQETFTFNRKGVIIYGSDHKTSEHIFAFIRILSVGWLHKFEKFLDEGNREMEEFVERAKVLAEPDNYQQDPRKIEETNNVS